MRTRDGKRSRTFGDDDRGHPRFALLEMLLVSAAWSVLMFGVGWVALTATGSLFGSGVAQLLRVFGVVSP
ncbi:hypothetical protein [Leifsonia sp. AG29]|uniref:hypothetical protein n=1 Tax=Leifsonia sp. AG29 TaxID=2598860 RepID=UPI00131CE09C|nr:hypothetical protein [Leifsonia sp. AG29]